MTNTIELAENKLVSLLKEKLAVLKKVEDEDVKKAVTELEVAVSEYEVVKNEQDGNNESGISGEVSAEEGSKEEGTPSSDAVNETPEEPVKEEPVEEKAEEEPVKEEAPAEEKKSEELSLKVAEKLKEAAIELESKEKELSAKTEIIDGFKNKIVELNTSIESLTEELNNYKEKEKIELAKEKKNVVGSLLELYKGLGISKTEEELNEFNTAQLIELRKALEITVEKKNTSVRETVALQASKPQETKKKSMELSDDQVFVDLFGQNVYNY